MIYLDTKSINPYYNLAFEEFVLLTRLDGGTFNRESIGDDNLQKNKQ
ncbi:MAG: hypothetical protein PWP51_3010 [Clostridiales bacterium]|nr:hypothetical protein [Clostridiales bacterium]MDN5300457.1 hypothetical protein [Clostridiales bacterium]